MKILIILLFVTNIYAKEKNIFFDAELNFPLKNTKNSDSFFMGVSLGYSINIVDNYSIEPSLGYHFSSKGYHFLDFQELNEDNSGTNYNYYDITLPIMYHKKGFKAGLYMKYIKIPEIESSDFYGERRILFQDKEAYAIGTKAVFKSWFLGYEYLFNGKYNSEDNLNKINLEGSYLSIGLRHSF